MGEIAIFVMSCDKTSDVAKLFIKGFSKYWPDCPFPIYLGTNNNIIDNNVIGAIPAKSTNKGWRQESLDQLQYIKSINPNITHLLVFLDDFIFYENVKNDKIIPVLSDSASTGVFYLRCKRLEEGFIRKILQNVIVGVNFGNIKCFKIRKNHPYYSSLQVVLWDIDHLIDLIKKSESIWSFEHSFIGSKPHFTVIRSLFKYKHVVEKGEWDFDAKEYCLKTIGYFNAGSRSFRKRSVLSILKSCIQKITFNIWGYSIFNIKKRIINLNKTHI